jgi:hypothetical protein
MHKWDPVERGHGEQADLENRLAAYYGPELQEQPLPEASWLRLKTRLEPQRSSKRQRLWQWYKRSHLRPGSMRRHIHRRSMPAKNMKDTFSRLVFETRQTPPLPALHCSFKAHTRAPTVRVSPLGRRNIKLILPSNEVRALEPSELDVLLATGLARRFYIRKPAHILLQLLLMSVVLFACIALILSVAHKASIYNFLIAAMLCIAMLGLLQIQGRRRAFRADVLVVQWLGRSRACQGLHALADRNRSRRRSRWGEPSLAERIDRVCGTQVTSEASRLTLVR